MSKRLGDFDVQAILEESSDDDFSSGSGDEYIPSESESNFDEENEKINSDSSDEDNEPEVDDVSPEDEATLSPPTEANFDVIWSTPEESFRPRKVPSSHRKPALGLNFKRTDTPIQIFKKMFPPSLITKEVAVISNCHRSSMVTVEKKQKNGKKVVVPCPEMIQFYRSVMGGVDRADQLSGMYELDRKSQKWWKKVFYRLVMMSSVNSWIIYIDLHRTKEPFLEFLVLLAESLIAEGQETAVVRRSLSHGGYHSKKKKIYGQSATHLPIEGPTRRRCTGCQKKKIEKRTKTLCQDCQLPLCKNCFAPFHQ